MLLINLQITLHYPSITYIGYSLLYLRCKFHDIAKILQNYCWGILIWLALFMKIANIEKFSANLFFTCIVFHCTK